jgi:hypothetical protein
MKKLLLLPFLLITLFSCSTDDAVELNNTVAEAQVLYYSTNRFDLPTQYECFTSLSAYTNIDVSNGFDNPVVQFIADSEGAPKKISYSVTLEVQPLSECEDMESNYGPSIQHKYPGTVQNPDQNMPMISLLPSQLPGGCYKWRYIFTESLSSRSACASVTQWYEAPLF